MLTKALVAVAVAAAGIAYLYVNQTARDSDIEMPIADSGRAERAADLLLTMEMNNITVVPGREEGGVTVTAAFPIPKGGTILSIPTLSVISVDTLWSSLVAANQQSFSSIPNAQERRIVELMLLLIDDAFFSPYASSHHHYYASLPRVNVCDRKRSMDLPMRVDAAAFDLLTERSPGIGTNLATQYGLYQVGKAKVLELLYGTARTIPLASSGCELQLMTCSDASFQPYFPCSPEFDQRQRVSGNPVPKGTLELIYHWAWAIITTRALTMEVTDTRRSLVLIPGFDLLNHDPRWPHFQIEPGPAGTDDRVVLAATADIEAGDEIFASYAPEHALKCNSELFIHYGFVIYDHPPSDCLLLRIPIGNDPYVQSLGVEEAKAALQVRMSLLREHDIGILDPMDMTGNDYEYQRTIAEAPVPSAVVRLDPQLTITMDSAVMIAMRIATLPAEFHSLGVQSRLHAPLELHHELVCIATLRQTLEQLRDRILLPPNNRAHQKDIIACQRSHFITAATANSLLGEAKDSILDDTTPPILSSNDHGASSSYLTWKQEKICQGLRVLEGELAAIENSRKSLGKYLRSVSKKYS